MHVELTKKTCSISWSPYSTASRWTRALSRLSPGRGGARAARAPPRRARARRRDGGSARSRCTAAVRRCFERPSRVGCVYRTHADAARRAGSTAGSRRHGPRRRPVAQGGPRGARETYAATTHTHTHTHTCLAPRGTYPAAGLHRTRVPGQHSYNPTQDSQDDYVECLL